jgi:hypothetical protein
VRRAMTPHSLVITYRVNLLSGVCSDQYVLSRICIRNEVGVVGLTILTVNKDVFYRNSVGKVIHHFKDTFDVVLSFSRQ